LEGPMRGILGVFFVSCLLTGCGVVNASKYSQMDAFQVANLSDDQVCHPLANSPTLKREREFRGLGDCDPVTLQCKKMGYPIGSKEYLACRQTIAQESIAANAERQRFQSSVLNPIATAHNAPTMVQTSCHDSGFGNTSCVSY